MLGCCVVFEKLFGVCYMFMLWYFESDCVMMCGCVDMLFDVFKRCCIEVYLYGSDYMVG